MALRNLQNLFAVLLRCLCTKMILMYNSYVGQQLSFFVFFQLMVYGLNPGEAKKEPNTQRNNE